MPDIECSRCGFKWEIVSSRNPESLCVSCRARRVQTVQSVQGKCYPWHGHYAPDLITPIREDGTPVIEGERLCGNTDCVNPSHALEKEEKNANQNNKVQSDD